MINVDKYESMGFHNWQIEEIKLAIKNGVSDELIEEYMEDVDLNSYQLQQIRLGLQEGLDVSLFARKDIPFEEMQKIRLKQLEDKLKVEDEKAKQQKEIIKQEKKETRRSRLSTISSFFTILLIVVILVAIGSLAYIFKDTIYKALDILELDLSKETIELNYGDKFDADDYVINVSEGEEIIKMYPNYFTTDELGDFNLEYIVTNNVKTLKRYLKVKVVDKQQPTIELSESNITLIRDQDVFNGYKYIDSVSDNYDPNPRVEISPIDWSKNNQEIEYKVIDSEGNESIKTLTVQINNKPKPVISNNSTQNNTTNSSQTTQQGSTSSQSNNTPSNGGSTSSSGQTQISINLEDYQPSNNQYDIHVTTNGNTETYTSVDDIPDDVANDPVFQEFWND